MPKLPYPSSLRIWPFTTEKYSFLGVFHVFGQNFQIPCVFPYMIFFWPFYLYGGDREYGFKHIVLVEYRFVQWGP